MNNKEVLKEMERRSGERGFGVLMILLIFRRCLLSCLLMNDLACFLV